MRRIGLLCLLTAYCLLPTAALAQSVDLVWQGETYTPPFYKGRSLWTNESRATLTAIPNLPNANPASLYYRWSKDGTVLGSLSGVGRRSITFVDTVLSLPIEVRVDVRAGESGEILGSTSVALRPSAPRLLVVEESPLYGLMLHRPVEQTYELESGEVTFAALPLFASVSARNVPALAYTWTTNSGDVRTGSEVTYRAPDDSAGTSAVSVRLVNERVLVQPPEKSFLVEFGNQTGF